MLEDRFYRLRRARVIARGLGAFYVCMMLFAVLGDAHDYGRVRPFSLLLWGSLMLGTTALCRRLARSGLYETAEGLVSVSAFLTERVRWDQVEGFTRAGGRANRVRLHIRDGRLKSVDLALSEGQPVVWEGGETRAIIAVLLDRLALRQAALDDPAAPERAPTPA